MYRFLIVLITYLTVDTFNIPETRLKPLDKIHVKIPEPSDITYIPVSNQLAIVSDQGHLYTLDIPVSGKKSRPLLKSEYRGSDFEAVCYRNNKIYAVEERFRNILPFNLQLKLEGPTVEISYGGGKNKAYEGLTWSPELQQYYLFTEKDPVQCILLDSNFQVKGRIYPDWSGDVSAATWYMGKLYILSDEEKEIRQVDPISLAILHRYNIPVWNAEGLCFLPDGRLLVLSDDMAMIYVFKI